MNTQSVVAELTALDHIKTLPELKQFARQLFSQWGAHDWVLGLKTSYSLTASPSAVLTTFPLVWLLEYQARGYMRKDPLIIYAQTKSLPLIWDATCGWENHSAAEQAFMARVQQRGWFCGICVPIHSAEWAHGTFNIAMKEPLSTARPKLESLQPVVTFIVLSLAKAMHRICSEIHPQNRPLLSPREIECLTWACEGKSSWEISAILDISERTVNQHLQASIDKLGVKNRQQAIAQAIAQAIIRPHIADHEILNDTTDDCSPCSADTQGGTS